MAELMCNHAREFLGGDGAGFEFLVKTAGNEDPPIGGGKTIDGGDFVDMHLDPRQIEGAGQFRCHLAQGRVEQFCRFLVQLLRGAPSGKAIHGKPVEHGEKDGEDADHVSNMDGGARGARVE